MSEGKVVSSCIQLLCLWGCPFVRNNSGAIKTEKGYYFRFGKKGSGDIIACGPAPKDGSHARYIEIECKVRGNVLSPEQRLRKQEIEACNGIYIVAYSLNDLEARKNDILGIKCAETA